MDENKKTPIGTLILMGIGFIVSGVMGAATASELPDAVKKVGAKMANVGTKEESTETTTTE